MGQAFSRLSVQHSPAPRRTSRRSSHNGVKSTSEPPSPGRPPVRRVYSRVTSSSPISAETHRQHQSGRPPNFYFSERSNQVREGRPSSSGTVRSSGTQHQRQTNIGQQEHFTPLPPVKSWQSQGSPRKPPVVESSRSSSSGMTLSDDSSSNWSGPMPRAPMPPNWNRDFYSGISPRQLRDVRLSQRENGYRETPKSPHHDTNQTHYRKRAFTYPAYATTVEVEIYPEDLETHRSQPRFTHQRQRSHPSMGRFSGEDYVHVWSIR